MKKSVLVTQKQMLLSKIKKKITKSNPVFVRLWKATEPNHKLKKSINERALQVKNPMINSVMTNYAQRVPFLLFFFVHFSTVQWR